MMKYTCSCSASGWVIIATRRVLSDREEMETAKVRTSMSSKINQKAKARKGRVEGVGGTIVVRGLCGSDIFQSEEE